MHCTMYAFSNAHPSTCLLGQMVTGDNISLTFSLHYALNVFFKRTKIQCLLLQEEINNEELEKLRHRHLRYMILLYQLSHFHFYWRLKFCLMYFYLLLPWLLNINENFIFSVYVCMHTCMCVLEKERERRGLVFEFF